MLGPTTFRFLNKATELTDWNEGHEKLWLYHLHYFEDLNAADWEDRRDWHRQLLECWISDNTPGKGVGWESYPLSRRIVNWIKSALAGNDLIAQAQHSLAVQARHLTKRVEWHLLGNHLWANAVALVYAGVFFQGKEAQRWRRKGLDILKTQLPEQILADGGHFELSPMYHALVLEDLLDLINLANTYPSVLRESVVHGWRSAAVRMLSWLRAMSHPDGEISFFNDASFGVAVRPGQLEAYSERLGLTALDTNNRPLTRLTSSGYLRIALGDMVALLDTGDIGPDYQPGHGHADTLSFELSLFGQRTLVNSGTSQYGTGSKRAAQRSTAAHNTLEVDSQNSSEVWAGFRVARRARPSGLHVSESTDTIRVRCAHDGYHRLPGRVTHQRTWTCTAASIEITDHIDGDCSKAVARYHVHPDVDVELNGPGGILVLPEDRRVVWVLEGARGRLSPASYHCEFGLSLQNKCIEAEATGSQITMTLSWS